MKKSTRTFTSLAAFALLSASAFAANVTISLSGTFNASAPTNTYSAPNANWTLSFQVNNPPSVFTTNATEFRTLYSSAIYTLNGNPVPVTGSTVIFSSIYSFNIFLDSPVVTQFTSGSGGPQLFSGSPSSPTMVPGSYPLAQVTVATPNPGGGFFFANSTSSNIVISVTPANPSATPLPSTAILMSIGVAGLAMLEMLRRKQSRA